MCQRLKLASLVIFALLVGQLPAVAQEETIEERTPFTKELKHLRRYVSFSDDEAAALKQAVDPMVLAANQARHQLTNRIFGSDRYDIIWPRLYEDLLKTVRKHVATEKEFAAFVADLRRRQQFEREFAIDSAMIMMDRAIGFSSKKREKVEKILTELQVSGLLPAAPDGDWTRTHISQSLHKFELSPKEKAAWGPERTTTREPYEY